MYYPGIFQTYFLFYSAMQYLGWVGQFVAFLMTRIQNARVGDGELKKINFQQHPQGQPESQSKHHHRHPTDQDHLCYFQIQCLLLPDILTSMFNFYLLFLFEIRTDIAWRLVGDTAVLILDILKCGGSSPPMSEKCGGLVNKIGTCTSAKEGLTSEAFVCMFVSRITQMLLHGKK